MEETLLTVVLSSTVIGGIISSLVMIILNRRSDYIENITKERKIWREEMRRICKDLSEANSEKSVFRLLEELKPRINANGIGTNHVLDDSYLWQFIDRIEKDRKNCLNEKGKIISLISCLLKYDWEKSKEEIRGDRQLKLLIVSLMISFTYFTLIYFLRIDVGNLKGEEVYLNYCIIFTTSVVVYITILSYANSWKSARKRMFNHSIFAITSILYLVFQIHFVVNRTMDIYSWKSSAALIDWIIILNPILAMIYSYIIRNMKYRNNVGRLIVSTMVILECNTILPQYKCFLSRKVIDNLKV